MQPTDLLAEARPAVQNSEELPEEQPQEPYYSSPQAQSMDQMLNQAESSLTPVILAALIAAYALSRGTQSAFSGINNGVSLAANLTGETLEALAKMTMFVFKRDNAARLDMLKRELLPFGVRAIANLLQYAPRQQINLLDRNMDIYALSEQAVSETLDHVFGAIDQSAAKTSDYIDNKNFRDDTGLFDTLEKVFSGESAPEDLKPYTKKQRTKDAGTDETEDDLARRHMINAACRFARLIVRDVAFRAQEQLAKTVGFTHKRWVTCQDERVRLLHRARHGAVLPIGQRFQGPGGGIRWPGDPAAPLNDTANCRCSLEWIKR